MANPATIAASSYLQVFSFINGPADSDAAYPPVSDQFGRQIVLNVDSGYIFNASYMRDILNSATSPVGWQQAVKSTGESPPLIHHVVFVYAQLVPKGLEDIELYVQLHDTIGTAVEENDASLWSYPITSVAGQPATGSAIAIGRTYIPFSNNAFVALSTDAEVWVPPTAAPGCRVHIEFLNKGEP